MTGVWHKDGPIAQILQMADWAEREAEEAHPGRETIGKIARNIRAAVTVLQGPTAVGDDLTVRLRSAAGELRECGLVYDADLMLEAALAIDAHGAELVSDAVDTVSVASP